MCRLYCIIVAFRVSGMVGTMWYREYRLSMPAGEFDRPQVRRSTWRPKGTKAIIPARLMFFSQKADLCECTLCCEHKQLSTNRDRQPCVLTLRKNLSPMATPPPLYFLNILACTVSKPQQCIHHTISHKSVSLLSVKLKETNSLHPGSFVCLANTTLVVPIN